ncbi:hypothetical protein LX36DRAFT_43466 [Colletotrichum falcatum]|nr:hypothetical protein LX36DRAFT_43466 [Colletotrichum falcatum]
MHKTMAAMDRMRGWTWCCDKHLPQFRLPTSPLCSAMTRSSQFQTNNKSSRSVRDSSCTGVSMNCTRRRGIRARSDLKRLLEHPKQRLLSCLSRLISPTKIACGGRGRGLLHYFGWQGPLFVSLHLRQRVFRNGLRFGHASSSLVLPTVISWGQKRVYGEKGKKRGRVDDHGLKLYVEQLRLS